MARKLTYWQRFAIQFPIMLIIVMTFFWALGILPILPPPAHPLW